MPPQHEDLRAELAARLTAEGRPDLAEPLRDCGEEVLLTCTNCGNTKTGHTHCDRKYCPACMRKLAARRTSRIRNAVAEFRWPLFITLTVPNSPDVECVRRLRADFGKLRRRVAWSRTVKSGVASIEVTNIGHGWHPHLHAVVDCQWLSINVPEPPSQCRPDIAADLCRRAAAEFSALWAKVTGNPQVSVKIKRTVGSEVVMEVLKYALKADELLIVEEPLGPLIDVLCATRLVTTFGDLYGRGRELDAMTDAQKPPCTECGEQGAFAPPEVIRFLTR